MEFSSSYSLRSTHLQRLATVLRVPLFLDYTMPSATVRSESSALYKQLLLRSIAVIERSDKPPYVQSLRAFSALCPGPDGATAFNRGWLECSARIRTVADAARQRVLERYEVLSVWETEEVQRALLGMYL